MDAVAIDRAMGALAGVAMGDAMGMPAQTLSRAAIRARYGVIGDLLDAAADQPVSAGLKAGTITDDTEQSLLLARHLIDRGGGFDETAWALSLLDWERDTRARGVNDLLGPSTRRAIDALLQGVPAHEAGRFGATNGAAMRIVPVGVATPPEPLAALVDRVEATCRLTHNTADAIGAAAAVAAIVSAGIAGEGFEPALPLALAAAAEGERRRNARSGPGISAAIAAALDGARGRSGLPDAIELATRIGTSVAARESVPMAFAIVRLAGHDPWQAALLSANIGDDTDTIGAMACGMAGACAGFAALPQAKWQRIAAVNGLELEPLVRDLMAIRDAQHPAPLRLERVT
jgi:ADP-ribosylglycohydrolase